MLAVALTRMRNLTCSGCGQPLDETLDTNHEHRVKTPVCSGCAALDKHRNAQKDPTPGEKPYVEPHAEEVGVTKFPPRFD